MADNETATNMAQDYADGIARRLWRLTEADRPFGWRNEGTDESTEDRAEVPELDENGRDADGNEWVAASPSDWFADALDFRYVIDGQHRTYRAAQVWVTIGGPNAWIDTEDKEVRVSWGGSQGVAMIPGRFCSELDDFLDDMWQMGA